MSQIKRVGIDTSKAVFTLHCVDQAGQPVLRTNLRRPQMAAFFKKLPPAEIGMEACGSSHHWARELSALGHDGSLRHRHDAVHKGGLLGALATVCGRN